MRSYRMFKSDPGFTFTVVEEEVSRFIDKVSETIRYKLLKKVILTLGLG